jgi:hypothetical protein
MTLAAAPPEPLLTNAGLLVGEWEATGGNLVKVEMLANRTVIARGGKLADGTDAGIRIGAYKSAGRGVWSIVVRDDQDRAYNFSVVLRRPDAMTVFDGKGNQATLQRVHLSFDKLDKNRDGVITEDEIDDPVWSRRLYEYTTQGGHAIDRQTFAKFMEKQALHRSGK